MVTTAAPSRASHVLRWFGAAVLLGIGLPLTGAGILGSGSAAGRGSLCLGLALLVNAIGGIAHEVVDARARHRLPDARLVQLDGEPALHLSRAPGPTLVSSWTLAGLSAVTALAALFSVLDQRWAWAVLLAVLAAWLGWTSGVHLGGGLAGGLWLTPTRIVHEDRGLRVEAPWESVTGVVPRDPVTVLLSDNHSTRVTRTGPRGRARRPLGQDGTTLAIDARHLAGGSSLASYVVAKAVTDPASRPVLGTLASLPRREHYG